VHLHPDVLKENAETDIFALDLGLLADGSGTVAPVYRDADSFFRASYVTVGLKSLLDEVLKRLAGKGGAPVLKLMTPFGGGKSHTMAALLHASRNRKALDVLPEANRIRDVALFLVSLLIFFSSGKAINQFLWRAIPGFHCQFGFAWQPRQSYFLRRRQKLSHVLRNHQCVPR